jgi:glutathione S-transferase
LRNRYGAQEHEDSGRTEVLYAFQAEGKTLLKEHPAKRFDYAERQLSKHDYLMEGGFSVADAYLFVVTGWSGFVGIELQKWPRSLRSVSGSQQGRQSRQRWPPRDC